MMQVTFSRCVIFGLLLALSPFVAFGQEAVIQVQIAEEEPVTDAVDVPQEKKDEKPKEEEEEARQEQQEEQGEEEESKLAVGCCC